MERRKRGLMKQADNERQRVDLWARAEVLALNWRQVSVRGPSCIARTGLLSEPKPWRSVWTHWGGRRLCFSALMKTGKLNWIDLYLIELKYENEKRQMWNALTTTGHKGEIEVWGNKKNENICMIKYRASRGWAPTARWTTFSPSLWAWGLRLWHHAVPGGCESDWLCRRDQAASGGAEP